jgi:hypothetical protein
MIGVTSGPPELGQMSVNTANDVAFFVLFDGLPTSASGVL